jgi:hypothetical protein
MTVTPSATFQIMSRESCVIEKAAMSPLGGMPAQRGHVKHLRLADTAGSDREDSREHAGVIVRILESM